MNTNRSLRRTLIWMCLFVPLWASGGFHKGDFLMVDGTVLRKESGAGEMVTLQGTNLGGWFVQEGWMSPNGYGALPRGSWKSDPAASGALSFDGNPATAWTAEDRPQERSGLQIALGEMRAFDRIALVVGSAFEDRLSKIEFRISKDGTSWTKMKVQRSERFGGELILSLDNVHTGNRIWVQPIEALSWSIAEINLLQNDDYTVRETLQARFGLSVADELCDAYQEAWITGKDLDLIKSWGLNVVRIPLNYLEFAAPDGTWKPRAFDQLDRVVRECSERELYVILDLHAAPGGASPWASSGRAGDDGTGQNPNGFWTDERCLALTAQIWTRLAEHYRGNPAIAGYDLINEPLYRYDEQRKPGEQYSTGALKKGEMFDHLYRAVRRVDPDHMIFIAAYTVKPPENDAFIGTPSGFDGIVAPSHFGWTNVVYETHHYDMPNARDHDAQQRLVTSALADIAKYQREWSVPVYAGEYSLYEFYDVWSEWMAGLNALNVSWTNWTYKVRGSASESGGGNWGFFNDNQNEVPDIRHDTPDLIRTKWARFETTYFKDNLPLIAVVSKHAAPGRVAKPK